LLLLNAFDLVVSLTGIDGTAVIATGATIVMAARRALSRRARQFSSYVPSPWRRFTQVKREFDRKFRFQLHLDAFFGTDAVGAKVA